MARGRSGKKYPKQSILQQKLNRLKSEGYEPTADLGDENYESTSRKPSCWEDAKNVSISPVRSSETPFERIKRVASEYSSILAWVTFFVTAATAVLYLNYDISHMKEDVSKIENDVKKASEKIINVEKIQSKNEQEIFFVNEKLSRLEKAVDTNQKDIKDIIINKK